MPLSSGAIGAISGGAQSLFGLIGSAIGARQQRLANEQQMNYEKEMYEKQKADRIDFWKMENLYNSPEQQMQRLKQAGLNPNLVYGNGADAMGGNIQAPTPQTSDLSRNKQPFLKDMGQNLGNIITSIYDLKQRDAQMNLLEEQTKTQMTIQELNAMTSGLRSVQQQGESKKNKYLEQQLRLGIREKLADISNTRSQTRVNLSQERLNQVHSRTNIDQNVREWQKQDLSVKQLFENIQKTKNESQLLKANTRYSEQQINTSQTQEALNALDFVMTRSGFSKNDTYVARLMKNIMFTLTQGKIPQKEINDLKNYAKKHTH